MISMTQAQAALFARLAEIQEGCVQQCLCRHGGELEAALYDATYEMTVGILELLDGYTPLEGGPWELVHPVTGEFLRGRPPVQLHDLAEGILRIS